MDLYTIHLYGCEHVEDQEASESEAIQAERLDRCAWKFDWDWVFLMDGNWMKG